MGSVGLQPEDRLHSALDDAHQRFIKDHPLSKKFFDERCNHMPGGNSRTVLYSDPFPQTIASARSCYLTTVEGQEYIDFLGEYTAGIYGHNHPVIKKAIEEALGLGWSYGAHNVKEGELASIVCKRFPAIEMVRFVNSGTEANMMALATALAFTGKKKVLIFEHGYHGSTISGHDPPGKKSVNLPHDFVYGIYNDIEGTKKLLESLPPDSLAAILVEPMLGSGGCYIGSKNFLDTLRSLATQYNALLIFDEVMTSRLSYNGRAAHLDITPDMMTLGKWIGGGLSFGAFGGRKDIMKMYDPRNADLAHPGTFNNNIFSMTAGIAGCNLLDATVIGKLNALGTGMRKSIRVILRNHGILEGIVPDTPMTEEMHDPTNPNKPPKMFINGLGSMLNLHWTGPDREVLKGLFYHHLLSRHIFIAQRGFITLNIEITQEHIDKFLAALEEFCCLYEEDLKW